MDLMGESLLSALTAVTVMMVEQLGLEIMPLCQAMSSGFT
jgi:hypothetical protein